MHAHLDRYACRLSLRELYTFWMLPLFAEPNSEPSQKVLCCGSHQNGFPIHSSHHPIARIHTSIAVFSKNATAGCLPSPTKRKEYNQTMNDIRFPKSVIVTDQPVDCTHMSKPKQAFVIEFTKNILDEFARSGAKRKIYGIVGPSGSGKTFLSILAKEIGHDINRHVDIAPVSIDAFHFSNQFLSSTKVGGKVLKDVKGRYDTYDIPALVKLLEEFRRGGAVRFPEYSRKTHEPIQDAIAVNDRPTILLLEGLWLLYDKAGWAEVNPLLDSTFYIDDVAEESRSYTLLRHMFGGKSDVEANRYYEESDAKNRDLVVQTKQLADEILRWPK